MEAHEKSSKQISAGKASVNRANAQLSTGPANMETTRYNATKHGLLSEGVTELDNPEKFQALIAQLKTEIAPVGFLEHECVQQIALLTIRIRRARRLEAEAFTAQLIKCRRCRHRGVRT